MRRLNVVVFGLTISSSWGNGHGERDAVSQDEFAACPVRLIAVGEQV